MKRGDYLENTNRPFDGVHVTNHELASKKQYFTPKVFQNGLFNFCTPHSRTIIYTAIDADGLKDVQEVIIR